ncbi:lamin tail domain-containing protein [Ulvibacter antarcticus]|uniref:Lamin tail-like protein n=1 Tax=Ulvibacter antarcticus TaxID=442714 RepID=A0A3L9YU27_9FLAO|nr:lamin tail domain-containing protein [Ulvibacter antarcticus]RMA64251.1 lamin tail-like protein [Ulvibacter antarcticus]
MKNVLLAVIGLFISTSLFSQVGIGTLTPSDASMLDVSSTSDSGVTYKGFMPPRVPSNTERDMIAPTVTDVGLLVFVESTSCLQIWSGTAWENVFCNATGVAASDLFISEYVEGSSNNKAIEIANFTGATVNLDNYQLFLSRNGGTTSDVITFNTGFMLADGAVYVIKHASASGAIIANQTDSNLNFNGNDALVLQTSAGVNIDAIGTVGDATVYAQDVTLQKQPTFGPSSTYTPANFDSFPVDTFTGLGSHTY